MTPEQLEDFEKMKRLLENHQERLFVLEYTHGLPTISPTPGKGGSASLPPLAPASHPELDGMLGTLIETIKKIRREIAR